MADRVCIRGCTQRDVHYATCEDYGKPPEQSTCRGCAPRECREGSLICDRCFGRMRQLLADTRDLLGRLRAIADPAKATPLDQVRVASSSVEPVAPVGADLLDAIHAVESAVEWAYVDLASVSNELRTIAWLGEILLDRHEPVDGIRSAWSVQDAVDRWGVERRDPNQVVWEDDDDRAEIIEAVSEWQNPIIGREDAEGLAGSASTLRRWIKSGDVVPEGEIWIAGIRTRLFRRAQILAVREKMSDRQQSAQFRGDQQDQR